MISDSVNNSSGDSQALRTAKENAIGELDFRLDKDMISEANYDFLVYLINKADDEGEVRDILAMGTYYKRTGLHYDSRLELRPRKDRRIRYLKKNEELSFDNGGLHHKLIIGDNYPALQNLLVSHRGKVDIIYIDPPYGCDDMNRAAKTNYTNNLSRDVLLSQLHPRLLLAKELLTDEGVIFCSIDDKNQAYVRCLMDEVFGEQNFITAIPRLTKSQRSGQEHYMDVSHDYILAYAYCSDFVHITKRNYDRNKLRTDAIGTYIVGDTKAILADKNKGYSAGGDYDFEYNGTIYQPVDKNGVRNRWLWTRPRMEAAAKLGILVETGTTLRSQLYIDKKFDEKTNTMVDKHAGMMIFHTSDFMTDNSFSNSVGDILLQDILGGKRFDNPKPIELIKSLISLVDKKDAVVLDYYAGSGTTGQAVLDLNKQDGGNRTFILATNDEVDKYNPNGIAHDVTFERLYRTMLGQIKNGFDECPWLIKNSPYGDSLDVYVCSDPETGADVSVLSNTTDIGNSPFDVIDETIYGLEKFDDVKDKIKWVCENFETTCSYLSCGEGV